MALMFRTVGKAAASSQAHGQAEDLAPRVGFINRWELENLHEYANPRGTAWTATLCFGGLPVGLIENMGDGGTSWPMFNSSAIEDVWFTDIHEAYFDADQKRFIAFLETAYDGVRVLVNRHGDESVA